MRDVQLFEGALKTCVTVPLAQHEYDAYVSFAYNLGPRAFCQSTLVKKLNAQDYPGACQELLRWRFFQGQDCAAPANARLCGGLAKRRDAEYRQCIGELPTAPRDADAPAEGLALSAVAATVVTNYQTCHENAEQLKALQDWIRQTR